MSRKKSRKVGSRIFTDNNLSRVANKIAVAPSAGETKVTARKPLTWKHNKSGLSGTFVALYEEVLDGVPEKLSAKPAERITMYNRVIEAIGSAKKNNVADTGSVVFDIPWTMLDFPADGVGREKRVDKGHVGFILTNYRAHGWAVPVVTMRPVYDDYGTLVTVLFEVTDGFHRRTVTLERAYADRPEDLQTGKNPVKITVSVSPVETTKETAESFADNNAAGKRPMARDDDWRNMYIAGAPEVVATVDLAADYGLDASAPIGRRGWPRCHGKIIMHMCNVDFGGGAYQFPWMKESDVRHALRVITSPECVGVYKRTEAVNKQNFFAGLCHFIAYYHRPGYVHDIGLKHLLACPGIIDRALDIAEDMTPAIIRVEMPHVTEAMLSRNESVRYHSVAAALRRLYLANVPPPKARHSVWSDCPPEVRQLFHVAPEISDPAERAKFIAQMNNKLNRTTKKKAITR